MIFPQVRLRYNIISRDIINQIFCDAITFNKQNSPHALRFSVEASPTKYGLQQN